LPDAINILEQGSFIPWLQLHWIEVLATVTGFIYIVLTIREDIRLWFFGIISSALFIWVFAKSKIYAYSLLYIYYVLMGFYGWYNWSRTKKSPEDKEEKLSIRKSTFPEILAYITISIGFAVPVYYILIKFSDSDAPAIDALLTSSGMVATWMLTCKLIEQWLFWIIIDILSCGLMVYKHLYPSAALFFAYTLLAIKGYYEWKKELPARS